MALRASPFLSTITIIIVNVGAVVGYIIIGALIDRFNVNICILISTVGTAIGTFLF
jgi:MFS-type transporter involved in bile tolerance (Atg22 family)